MCVADVPTTVTNKRVVSGLSQEKLGNFIVVDDTTPIVVQNAAVLKVDTQAKWVRVKARKDGKRFSPEKINNTTWIFVGEGTYDVDIETTDPTKGVEDKILEIVVGAPTPPEPPPSPVPDDVFNNLGKRVATAASGLPKRQEIAKLYAEAATQLRNDPAATVNTVSSKLVVNRQAILGADLTSYNKLIELINTDLSTRWPMAKGSLADYFDIISKGLSS